MSAVKTKMTDDDAAAAFESGEFATGTHRDRSATNPIRAAVVARSAADDAVTAAVIDARSHGITWVEIAAALGVTHQAARQRYRGSAAV
ncbi:hypothetical protein Xcel_1602 [Xylanimonas cellulosilytica DSM 15894]|uniref:Uncharacterized protein n=1 Tax=Xylanimonas cellulosilytica (strain DSM 15894 / JCM 12276 / CECT 5975 / KCTC 9989 / LMG 20990 / NBRC 107835 / XIL07) TaxID=446471 RepID=D1BSD5_XYLCX|nr:hypothetical protein [Xylanimonas cellulosilytica]ACZ30627.1 hypothetical protein Xcel_1602 [Xylanimonas cellulosilytica DSM 15894]